ncbi:hypothetical protein [Candidatus Viridilinea mediisalina]|uniref:Uncharacterized protein n=1 Tax=Candidatus Viridilinea mediisalina TaxID=2024553 RepID=A0A2A6RGH0_9CHLR|nr:hypothetical protein [Candidatus Viridilinea mediisalina]PDW02224.1 hypothetical protein CJ255_15015 [Candidatus Viridilinea mediisalina]
MSPTKFYAILRDLLWSGGLAPLLVVVAILVSALAYQVPVAGHESLAANPSPLGFAAAHPPEAASSGFQRWTSDWTRVTIPGLGPQAAGLRLRFFAGEHATPVRYLTIKTLERELVQVPLRHEGQELRLYLPPGTTDRQSGDLHLIFQVDRPLVMPSDERQLGIALSWLEVNQSAGTTSLQAPPWARVGQLALVLLAMLWCLRLVGLPTRLVALPLLLFAGCVGLLLSGWPSGALGLRMQVAHGLPVLLQVLSFTLPLALVLRFLPWPRSNPQASFPAAALLRLAVLLIFSLRLIGLLHPQFILIDHGLRANQLLQIAAGQEALVRERLEQQYEWGTRDPVPYSLLTYYLLLPLTTLWDSMHQLVVAVKVVTALLEASFPLLFLALLRQQPHGLTAAAWAGLIYAALPVGFLFFHDGSFPTTIGIWLTLIALVTLQWLVAASAPALAPFPWLGVGLASLALALAIGAYVTHIAFVPFLVGVMALSLIGLGGIQGRWAGRNLLISLTLGLLLGWIMVYGSYTMTLIQRTIPSYLGLIVSEGSVGRDADAFFGTPINSFRQHMLAHFRLWPVIMATASLLVLLANWRERSITHLLLAYASLLIATSIAEHWFGLWNKHMVFVAPGVALAAGIGYTWLWQRGRAARLVALSLLAYLFWEVLIAWGNRVLWYHLPPSAL